MRCSNCVEDRGRAHHPQLPFTKLYFFWLMALWTFSAVRLEDFTCLAVPALRQGGAHGALPATASHCPHVPTHLAFVPKPSLNLLACHWPDMMTC